MINAEELLRAHEAMFPNVPRDKDGNPIPAEQVRQYPLADHKQNYPLKGKA